MSFLDSKLEIWDDNALTAQEESRTNGEILDLEAYGASDSQLNLWFNLLVGTAEDGTFNATGGYFQIVTSDSPTFATGSGAEQCVGSIGSADLPLLTADLAKGKAYSVGFPMRLLHRYVEVEFIPASTSAGALKVDAWFGLEPLSRPANIQKEPS
jgi:hypothetical protein